MLGKRTVRVAVASALVVIALMFGIVPAYADGGLDPVNCDAQPTAPECVINVIDASTHNTSGSTGGTSCHNAAGTVVPCFIQKYGWLAADGCYYKPASAELVASLDKLPPPAAWYEGTCLDAATGIIVPIVRIRVFAMPPGQALLVD